MDKATLDYIIQSSNDIAINGLSSLDKKAARLEEAKQVKLQNFQPAILRSVLDGDTIHLNNDPTATRIQGIDTYETPHSGDWLLNPYNQKRMDKQRAQLSSELGRPVTNEEVFQRGLQDKSASEKLLTPIDTKYNVPSLVLADQELNPNPMDKSPRNNYGRNLATVKPLAGEYTDVRTGKTINPTGRLLGVQEQATPTRSSSQLGHYKNLSRTPIDTSPVVENSYESNRDPNSITNNLLSPISGAVAMGSRLYEGAQKDIGETFYSGVSKAGDFLQKVASYTGNVPIEDNVLQKLGKYGMSTVKKAQKEQAEWRDQGYFDKTIGFDNSAVNAMGEQFKNNIKDGKVLTAVKDVLTNPAAITAFGQTLPDMLYITTGVGIIHEMQANTATSLNKLQENADKAGVQLTEADRAISVGLSVVQTYLDRIGAGAVLNKGAVKTMKDALATTLMKMEAPIRNEVVKTLAKDLQVVGINTAKLLGSTAVEGATEGVQQILQGKAEDKSLMNLSLTDKEIDKALVATGIGLGAGGVGTISTSLGDIKDIAKAGYDIPATLVSEGINKFLDKASEVVTNRTAKDVYEKKAAKQLDTTRMNKEALEKDLAEMAENINVDSTGDAATDMRISELNNQAIDMIQEADAQLANGEIDEATHADMISKATGLYRESEALKEETSAQKTKSASVEQDLRNAGLSDEEIAVFRDKAGISNVITQADREAGLGIAINTDEKVSTKEMPSKKEKLYDPAMADNTVLDSVINNGFKQTDLGTTKDSTFLTRLWKNFSSNGKKAEAMNEIYNEIKEKLSSDPKVQEAMKALSSDMSPAQALRAITVAVATIEGATKSEADIAEKYDLDAPNMARKAGNDVQVGKAYLNSFGLKLTGKSDVDIAAKYQKIGEQVIELAKAAGFITEAMGDFHPHRTVNEKNEQITVPEGSKGGKAAGIDGMLRDKGYAVADKYYKQSSKYESTVSLGNVLYNFNKIFNPINNEVPSEAVVDNVTSQRPISKEHAKIIKKLNKMSFKIKPEFIKFLEEIKDMAEDGDYDYLLYSNKQLQQLLGIDKQTTNLTKKTDIGRSINKKGNLIKLLENLDMLKEMQDGFHFSYDSAINQRIHVMQTVLEFQGDKFMARQILSQAKPWSTNNDKERQLLINNVIEESGLKNLEEYENTPVDLNKLPKDWQTAVDAMMSGDIDVKNALMHMEKLKFKSPFKMMSILQAIGDIQKAKDGKITTSYMIESDATASGAFNTFLNLMGYKKVQGLMQSFGIGKADTVADGFKPYERLGELAQAEVAKADRNGNVAVTKAFDIMKKYVYTGKDAWRELAKTPVMVWIYGQDPNNVKDNMADSIAVDVLTKAVEGDTNVLEYVNTVLGTNYSVKTEYKHVLSYKGAKEGTGEGEYVKVSDSIGNISREDKKALTKHFADTIGSIYVGQLSNAFPEVETYRKNMDKIYDMLVKTGTWDGTVESAMDVMLKDAGKDTKAYKMSIQKLKQVMLDRDGQQLQMDKMMNNKTSFRVNFQHAVDAALMLLTMDAVVDDDTGMMTVHDAVYSNAAKALEVMQKYNELSVEVASKYDFVETAFKALDEAIAKMPEGKKKNDLQNERDLLASDLGDGVPLHTTKEKTGLQRTIKGYVESKREALAGLKVKVLGDKTVDFDGEAKTGSAAMKETFMDQLVKTMKSVRSTIGSMEALTELVKATPVSKEYEAIKQYVLDALKSTDLKWYTSKKFEGGYREVGVPTSKEELYDNRTTNGVAMTPEALLETLAHEINHAYTHDYILNVGKDSSEVKYLGRVLEHIITDMNQDTPKMYRNLSYRAQRRMDYIYSVNKVRGREAAISELVSILTAEKSVSDEIKAAVAGNKLSDVIKALLQKVKEFVTNLVKKDPERARKILDNAMTQNHVMMKLDLALELVYATGKATMPQAVGEKANVAGETDPHKKEYKNPVDLANEMMARQNRFVADWMVIWGDVLKDALGPTAMKLHEAAKKYPIYSHTVQLIRSGFYDSRWAQKGFNTMGFDSSEKRDLIDKAQTISQNWGQEAQRLLEEMATLDREFKKQYQKSERKVLGQVFSNTGLAHIVTKQFQNVWNGLLDGTMDIDQAIAEVSRGMYYEKDGKLTDMDKIEAVAKYWRTGEITKTTKEVNTLFIRQDQTKVRALATLIALKEVKGGLKLLQEMEPNLRRKMSEMALSIKHMEEVINENKPDYNGEKINIDGGYYGDFDGRAMMDVYSEMWETVAVTEADMKSSKYSEENEWVMIKEPTKDTIGMVARVDYGASHTQGVGLNTTRYSNGFYMNELQSREFATKLEKIKDPDARQAYLDRNAIVQEGTRFRFLIDRETKIEKLGLIENPVQNLYRTYIHNAELIQMQTVKDMMLKEGVLEIKSANDMKALNRILQHNYEQGLTDREVVRPFVKISPEFGKYTYDELAKEYPYFARFFESPRNLSTYDDFNKNITFVKKGEADVLLGHKNFSIWGESDNRTAARWEMYYKRLVILAKQKWIVTNPVKLGRDLISNVAMLSMHQMSPTDIYKGFKSGWTDLHEYMGARNRLLEMQFQARIAFTKGETNKHERLMAIVEKQEAKMKKMKFHRAFEEGFVQSYSTDLVVKEHDAIAGVQKGINDLIDRYTLDEKGDPNKLHDAIKWWMQAGGDKFTVDGMFQAIANASKVKGTSFGKELEELSKRIKNKKSEESVAAYVSEFLGSPSSEVVAYGSAVMVMTDAISKYTLARFLMTQDNPRSGNRKESVARRKYTEDEAYAYANEVFIDYRRNLPSEIKALSDYGILMFPAYWLRIQKVLLGVARDYPVSALTGIGIEMAMGGAGLNPMGENIVEKVMSHSGLIHTPDEYASASSLVLAL